MDSIHQTMHKALSSVMENKTIRRRLMLFCFLLIPVLFLVPDSWQSSAMLILWPIICWGFILCIIDYHYWEMDRSKLNIQNQKMKDEKAE